MFCLQILGKKKSYQKVLKEIYFKGGDKFPFVLNELGKLALEKYDYQKAKTLFEHLKNLPLFI